MTHSALWWLFFNILSLIVLQFYSMMEMACVSFNRVRLQYYVSQRLKRAEWLNFLLHNPARLFGTTLIGVNVAMMVGSECAREFHIAIGINPDFAPLTQVIVVVIFGELAPMFAARQYTEHVAMLGIPLVYASAKILAPVIYALGLISSFFNKIFGGKEVGDKIFLSRDELQKIIEVHEEEYSVTKKDEFNAAVSNIFNLREKDASQIMNGLDSVKMMPANSTVMQLRKMLQNSTQTYIPLFNQTKDNIMGIVTPRDLILAQDQSRLRDYAKAPWFITKESKAVKILKQFRINRQKLAIVLDNKGKAIGLVTLDDVLEEVFGKISAPHGKKENLLLIERTFPGDMKVFDFNAMFEADLPGREDETLADLVIQNLQHNPEVGDAIYIEPFEIIVKEATLLDVKSVVVKTRVL